MQHAKITLASFPICKAYFLSFDFGVNQDMFLRGFMRFTQLCDPLEITKHSCDRQSSYSAERKPKNRDRASHRQTEGAAAYEGPVSGFRPLGLNTLTHIHTHVLPIQIHAWVNCATHINPHTVSPYPLLTPVPEAPLISPDFASPIPHLPSAVSDRPKMYPELQQKISTLLIQT